MPKITVIVPVFNDFDYLPQTLKSIQDQSFKDYELILVDDCSKDPMMAPTILSKFNFPSAKVIRHEKNKGLAAARNTGIKASKGEYLAFVDSDDIILSGKFEIQANQLDKNPEVGMVYSDEYTVHGSDTTWEEKKVQFDLSGPSGWIFPDFLARSFIAVFAVMVRRSVLDGVGLFNEEMFQNEDDELWFRIMLKYPVYFTQYVTGVRRLHDNNMSKNREKMYFYQYKMYLNYKREQPEIFAKYQEIFKKKIKSRMKSYLKYCFWERKLPRLAIFKQYFELMNDKGATK